ncbi:MAG: polyphenol oxidase family protein [Holophagaceae bacterium]|nr:polyphenol oxidase family protein [Holophagaceae bacterium]
MSTLTPTVQPPFPIAWGFSTRQSDLSELPTKTLAQVHGCNIWEASDTLREGDGHWTQEPRRRIGVRVADCVPILMAGLIEAKPWIAALHAGWRGATAGILRNGIKQFIELGGKNRDLFYAFGPCIQACHFEVGAEVIEVAKRDPAWHDGLATPSSKGKSNLDLHGLLSAQATNQGLDSNNDGSIQLCTLCKRDMFYSHRGGDSGRQWGWVEIL